VAVGEEGLEVGDGEGVFGVAGGGAVDLEAGCEGEGGGWFELAGDGDEMERLGVRGEGEGEGEEGCEGVKAHGFTVQHES
jgi:hypothetical protein